MTIIYLLRCSALFLAASSLADSAALHRQKASPDLAPTVSGSDKKFFTKDYQRDVRPVVGNHYVFGHPYPAVQDTGDYDSDFVKDENNDGGRWKAQMDYDILRHKITEAEKKLEELKNKLEQGAETWKKFSTDYKHASASEEGAAALRKKAEREAAEAAARVNELEGRSSADGTKVGGKVGRQVAEVNEEMADLEKCKEELAKAKQKLKDLLAEKEKIDGKNTKIGEDNEAAKAQADKDNAESAKKAKAAKEEAKKQQEEEAKKMTKEEAKAAEKARKAKKAREAAKARAQGEVDVRNMDEAAWKKKLDQEKSEQAEASGSYNDELADVKRTEAELKKAAENLRKYRRPPYVDDNGGVYYEPDEDHKSAAKLVSVSGALLFAAMAAIAVQ